MIRDVLPFLCARLFARCLINLFGRQQSGKEKREVKGISFTKNGDFIGGRFNRWARLFIFKRAPYSQQSRRCVADNQSDSFQDISDPEKDNLRLGFSILLVNYLSTAYN